jgi:hypothetical protein
MIARTRFYQIYTIHVVFKTTYTNLTGTTSLRQNVMIAHTRFYQIYTIPVAFKTTYTNLSGTTSLTSHYIKSTQCM